jgi:hypothetical protein
MPQRYLSPLQWLRQFITLPAIRLGKQFMGFLSKGLREGLVLVG